VGPEEHWLSCEQGSRPSSSHTYTNWNWMTTMTVQDLWDDPVAEAELLQQWDDVCRAAGRGLGSRLP